MKGRKKIPSKIIDLRGGTKHTHKKPRENEPKPPEKIPTCPAHLNNEAKKEWRRVSKILDNIGLITELDRATLAEYCESYGKWIDLKKELNIIKKLGNNPEFSTKKMSRRCEQYKVENKRWNEANIETQNGLIEYNNKGIPFFSPYLKIERDSASILNFIEKTIKKEIQIAEETMIKTGVLLGMNPSSRVGLKVKKEEKPDKIKEFMKRKK